MSNSKELSQFASFVEVNANTETITISANLVVQGTTTTISTEQVNISDNILLLNSDLPGGSVPTQDAGIRINRGSANTVGILYDESADAWILENNDGTVGTIQTASGTPKIDIVTPQLLANLDLNNFNLSLGSDDIIEVVGGGTINLSTPSRIATNTKGYDLQLAPGSTQWLASGDVLGADLNITGGRAVAVAGSSTAGDVNITGGQAEASVTHIPGDVNIAGGATSSSTERGNVIINDMIMPTPSDVANASNNQILIIDGTGKLNFGNAEAGGVDLTAFSVVNSGAASGNGNLQYNNSTGVFTFIPPALPTSILDLGITDGANGTVLTTDGQGSFAFLSVAAATGGGIALSDLSVGAEASASGNGGLSYNSVTGVFTYTPPTASGIGAVGLTSLSVTAENTAAGNGGITYNNTSGEFTYTPPTADGIGALSDVTLNQVAKHLSVSVATASGGGNLEFANNTGIFTYTPPSVKDTVFNSIEIGADNPASGSGAITFSAVSGNGVFQYTPPDLSQYLTSYTETNDLSSAVTWANIPDANVPSSAVTQHQGSLSISTSQITDISSNYLPLSGGTLSGGVTFSAGSIKGPATFVIDPAVHDDNSGTVVIRGNLQVDGSTTTINSTTLDVDDINITVAKGAVDAAAADGAGLTIDGASATFTYDASNDRFTSNKDFAVDLIGNVDGSLFGKTLTTDAGTVTYTVTVASKTAEHPANGDGSAQGYKIDGEFAPMLRLVPGVTYRFDQSDASNSAHPLRFYLDEGKTSAYSTGVTSNGTAGSSGAYTQIVVSTATPALLYYQCQNHANMGWAAEVSTHNLTGLTTDGLTQGTTNLYYSDSSARGAVSVTTATGSSGSGSLSYNSTSGVFTFTRPDLSSYLTSVAFSDLTTTPTTISGYGITDAFNGAFSSLSGTPTTIAGYGITDAFDGAYSSLTGAPSIPTVLTDLSITDGTSGQVLTTNGSGSFTFQDPSGGIENVVEDTTPQLGGSLETNGNAIRGTLSTAPSDNGSVTIYGGRNSSQGASLILMGDDHAVSAGKALLSTGGNTRLSIDASGVVTFNEAYTFPSSDGSSGQVLTTDGSGNLTFQDVAGTDEVTVFQIAYKSALLFG